MSLMTLASNAFWIPVCLLALALIVWDWKYPKSARKFVVAIGIAASLAAVTVHAQDYSWDACQACLTITSWALWWVAGCFLC